MEIATTTTSPCMIKYNIPQKAEVGHCSMHETFQI